MTSFSGYFQCAVISDLYATVIPTFGTAPSSKRYTDILYKRH